jgi:membrane protein
MIGNARNPAPSVIAAVVGTGALLLGASGVFGELQGALNVIWNVPPRPHQTILRLIRDRFLSFTMVLGTGFLLLVSLLVSAALAALNDSLASVSVMSPAALQIVNAITSFAVVTLMFAMIYKLLPDVRIAWNDVWIGATATSVLFTIGKVLIGLYLGKSSIASAYGAAGSLVIMLVWVYYSAQILFLGAEFTQVYAKKYGSHLSSAAEQPSALATAIPPRATA